MTVKRIHIYMYMVCVFESLLILLLILKLVYEELLERAKEKEEKEAKKRQRLGDDFNKLLHTFKVWGHSCGLN